jgi:parallel beta-helix repeat protein
MKDRRLGWLGLPVCLGAAAAAAIALGCGQSPATTTGTAGTGGTGAGGTSSGGTSSGGSGGTGGSGACIQPSADDQKNVVTAFINAKEGDTICFTEGTFHFDAELDLDTKGVTVQGAGTGKTIWDFSKQNLGQNGLLIKGDGVTVEGLTVKNTLLDGIRADMVKGITFKNVAVIWDADASTKNGAYGLYPVGSSNVMIDTCEVKGARDAGIYVGQSSKIVVKNSDVHGCVAGIEIENSTDAEVMNNHTHENTAGILVFNLPTLPVQGGARANVHDNVVENNNQANFGAMGTTVSKVPYGIGIMVLASDDNEIHSNQVKNNNSVGVLVVSYLKIIFGDPNDPNYDKFPQGNYTHDNTFDTNGTMPSPLVAAAAMGIKPIPDIVWDGCTDPNAMDNGKLTNCIMNNMDGGKDASYGNADLCSSPSMLSTDPSKVTCKYDPLPPQ